MALIAGETAEAEAGRPARMILKMNSLEDSTMIAALYAAAEAGVEIDLIVRGICCLIPEGKLLGGRIRVRSLVDRFLEHARVFWFYQGGAEVVYVGSADWMQRNLDRRVEVVFPILDPRLANRVTTMLRYQLADNQQARVIDGQQTNPRVAPGAPGVRAQLDYYRMLAR
jgi:polyphosphate kinase